LLGPTELCWSSRAKGFLATGIAGSLATPAPTVSFGQRERVCQMRDIDPA